MNVVDGYLSKIIAITTNGFLPLALVATKPLAWVRQSKQAWDVK